MKLLVHLLLLCNNNNLSFLIRRHHHQSKLLVAAFSSQSQNPAPPPTESSSSNNPISRYLIASCGFSSQKAASALKIIPKSTSIEQVDSVRHFFKQVLGFTDDNFRKLICNRSQILASNVEKTLRPNVQSLTEMGFTASNLESLIAYNPRVIVSPLAVRRLNFWQTFLGTNNIRDLVSLFRRNRGLINLDIDSGIAVKVSFLKEHGLSNTDIVGLVKRGNFINRSPKAIETVLNRAKELGFDDPKSPMFVPALSLLTCCDSASVQDKMDFFKGFGWSDEEALVVFKKAPTVFGLSNKNLQEKMVFLVGRTGCQQSVIVSNPWLLTLSLDKRLMPRHYVMEVLKSNEVGGKLSLCTIMYMSEEKFMETFILPHKEQVPDIKEIYVAACAGEILF